MKIEDSPAISHKQTGQSLNSGVKIFVFISFRCRLFETKTVKIKSSDFFSSLRSEPGTPEG